jgi:hypothetical protein
MGSTVTSARDLRPLKRRQVLGLGAVTSAGTGGAGGEGVVVVPGIGGAGVGVVGGVVVAGVVAGGVVALGVSGAATGFGGTGAASDGIAVVALEGY